ncbi:M1 family metallopeptidase [Thermococcus sp. EP1]|uniref:M1 family metallopeptidase n=1 Tax=Thermococcus sp. EP1 TaxID=1591054 RepID=UPI0006DC27DD|nr:M1 family aminopeptidase [Thermococcus sp. EP1]
MKKSRLLPMILIITLFFCALIVNNTNPKSVLIMENITQEIIFQKIEKEKLDELYQENKLSTLNASYHYILNISIEDERVSIVGIERVTFPLTYPALYSILFEDFKQVNRIIVYNASVTYRAFKDKESRLILLNITPKTKNVTVEVHFKVSYNPFREKPKSYLDHHLNQDSLHIYIPKRYFTISNNLKGNEERIKVDINYPKDYTLVILDQPSETEFWRFRPLLYNGSFEKENLNDFYLIFGKWNFYEGSIKVGNKTIRVIALTNEGEWVLESIKSILRFYSEVFMPYPKAQYFYIQIKHPMSKYRGHGLDGGIIATQLYIPLIAHETAHNWFGLYANIYPIHEGIATYADLLYENNLTKYDDIERMCLSSTDTIPIAEIKDNTGENMVTLYYKNAFVFRSLQFVLGDEVFFRGMRNLLEYCHLNNCVQDTMTTLKQIQRIFEEVSNQSLEWFFSEWFYKTGYPHIEVSNAILEKKEGVYLLTLQIVETNGFKMPLEVKVVDYQGKSYLKRIFVDKNTTLTFELKNKPETVIIDPNEWMINEGGSGAWGGKSSYEINDIRIETN